jgi:hypothetical protein
MDYLGRLLKGDQVLAKPDHVARAAYESRMAETVKRPKGPADQAPAAQAWDVGQAEQPAAEEAAGEAEAVASS